MPKLTFLQPGYHLEDILQALKQSHYAGNSPIIIWRIFCRL
jgi:hypothetical protein